MGKLRPIKNLKSRGTRLYRGKPVKGRKPRVKESAGRPRTVPLDEVKRTMVRRTDVEADAWERAARAESLDLKLPPGSELTVGPWLRRLANERAKELGAFVVEPVLDRSQCYNRGGDS